MDQFQNYPVVHSTNVGSCDHCGWRGILTLVRGVKSNRCPACGAKLDGSVRRDQPRVGRNAPCPCGSGRKYKKCCGG